MKARYLLPCSCGREITVETGQAGQTIRCSCGAEQEVPTLMRMSSLRRAEQAATAPPSRRWGLRQRLLLVGALIALPALALAAYLFWRLPTREQVVPTQAPLDELTVGQTWQIWQDLRTGIERRPFPAEAFYERLAQTNRQWLAVALSVFVAGLLIMVSSVFVPKSKRRRLPADSAV
ncbi:MAG: hypothetical protein GXY83_39495 [Rhodopirellula sp.]|nr:hypothetical protein [Rhodopirellula sp.]